MEITLLSIQNVFYRDTCILLVRAVKPKSSSTMHMVQCVSLNVSFSSSCIIMNVWNYSTRFLVGSQDIITVECAVTLNKLWQV